jgi:hypothetical protein
MYMDRATTETFLPKCSPRIIRSRALAEDTVDLSAVVLIHYAYDAERTSDSATKPTGRYILWI